MSENFPAHMSAESPLSTSPNPSKVISQVVEPLDNLGAHAKLQNPTTTPSGRISNKPEEREEKKMPFIVATYVYASSQDQDK
jgi:hypothetical protein